MGASDVLGCITNDQRVLGIIGLTGLGKGTFKGNATKKIPIRPIRSIRPEAEMMVKAVVAELTMLVTGLAAKTQVFLI